MTNFRIALTTEVKTQGVCRVTVKAYGEDEKVVNEGDLLLTAYQGQGKSLQKFEIYLSGRDMGLLKISVDLANDLYEINKLILNSPVTRFLPEIA